MKKTINILLNASTYYVCFRFFLWLFFAINREFAEKINYHYSDNSLWYLIWFVFPIVISVFISLKVQFKFLKQVGTILLPVLLIGTLVMGYLNNGYWGYWLRRPSVFSEIKEATSIISITDLRKSFDDDNFSIKIDTAIAKRLYGRQDLYYGNFERAIMTFEDNTYKEPDLSHWYEITKDKYKKIAKQELKLITKSIQMSSFLIQPETKNYLEKANRFVGKIIEFETKNNSFYYISLQSGEVENDHYPFYEFLINKKNSHEVIKKQVYFTDSAGIEGLEYANFAGLIDFLLLIITGSIVMVFNMKSLIMKRKKL